MMTHEMIHAIIRTAIPQSSLPMADRGKHDRIIGRGVVEANDEAIHGGVEARI